MLERESRLDDTYLRLYILLLDYDLKGDLFESVTIGFLAVLGIDEKASTLLKAYKYTPTLSKFIKIS